MHYKIALAFMSLTHSNTIPHIDIKIDSLQEFLSLNETIISFSLFFNNPPKVDCSATSVLQTLTN